MIKNKNKARKEEKIINKIFSNTQYIIEESEDPDFKVRRFKNYWFGVEVTEFYFNESNARMANIPVYFEEIMSKKEYRHKDDYRELEVKEITLIPDDGDSDKIVDAICQKLPSYEEYASILASKIKLKNQKYINYDKSLSHHNLIIQDMEHLLFNVEESAFFLCIMKRNLIQELKKSEFREIFLITKIKSGEHYFPLKLIALLAELYKLNHYLNKTVMEGISILNHELGLALYLQSIGFERISFIDSYPVEIICDGYGIIIDAENKVIVRQYYDIPIPEKAIKFNSIEHCECDLLSTEYIRKIEQLTSDTCFCCSLGLNIVPS